MRSPSARCLINHVDVYVAVIGRDKDGGTIYTYPVLTFPSVACTVQAQGFAEVVDDQQRVTKQVDYKIMFAQPMNLQPRAKIIWADSTGSLHYLFYAADRDEAGRGAAFTVHAMENT